MLAKRCTTTMLLKVRPQISISATKKKSTRSTEMQTTMAEVKLPEIRKIMIKTPRSANNPDMIDSFTKTEYISKSRSCVE